MLLEILVSCFALFAISRSWLRLKAGNESIMEFLFWIIIWTTMILIVFVPSLTSIPAKLLNVERGIDALVYVGMVVLFYSIYRIYSKIEKAEQDITKLTRLIAINENKNNNEKVRKNK